MTRKENELKFVHQLINGWIKCLHPYDGIFGYKKDKVDFPGGPVINNQSVNIGDTGLIASPGRFQMPHN